MAAFNPHQTSPINLTSHPAAAAVAAARPGMPLALAIALALLGLFVTAMAPANAEIISDSLTYTGSFNGNQLAAGKKYAQAFTTTSTGYQLTQVDVKLNLAPSASTPTGGSVLFSVYDVTTFNELPIPGSQVASLGSYAASNVTANDFSFNGQTVSLGVLLSLSAQTPSIILYWKEVA